MALSENEQHILDEMEHDFAVSSTDPDRRIRLRSGSTSPSHTGVHWTCAFVAFIAVAVGLRLTDPAGIGLAVSGYAMLVLALDRIVVRTRARYQHGTGFGRTLVRLLQWTFSPRRPVEPGPDAQA